MKRSKIATFKVKQKPKDKKTSKSFNIGDYFSIDFDMCLSSIESERIIYFNKNKKEFFFYPDEIYMIRMTYIDKYDVDIDQDKREYEEMIKMIKDNK